MAKHKKVYVGGNVSKEAQAKLRSVMSDAMGMNIKVTQQDALDAIIIVANKDTAVDLIERKGGIENGTS